MKQKLGIKRVVLYKHGVGYFERRGTIEGNDTIDLEFKSRDMNDVLKSMTVLDLSGGTIAAVSYDSTRPLEKLLEDAAVRIPDDGSVTSLMQQLKGARVRCRHGNDTLEGIVVGLEHVQTAQGDVAVMQTHVALLIGGTLRTLPMLELRDLTFLEDSVRKDIEFYLSTVLSSHKKDARRVSVFATGEGSRDLFVSYVIEAPVWKTSYRVLLQDQGGPLLQGWALVDNVGDEDWEDVDLALVAGLPVSFRHDLYSPRYMQRPEVRVQTEAAAAPVIPEEGYGAPMAAAPSMAPMMAARGGDAGSFSRTATRPKSVGSVERVAAMATSAPITTLTKDVGDLFEYRIAQPVTVRRNRSALVPVLQCAMKGDRVLLYNRMTREKNPMACIELTNTSELTLEGGPVSVTEGDLYVGEAMLDTMKPGDKRFVPFAVELGCRVSVDDQTDTGSVFKATVQNGQLMTESWTFRRTHFRIKLKSPKPATLFLEHPKDPSWELTATTDPIEVTDGYRRFKLSLQQGETVFTVSERTRQWQTYNLSTLRDEDVTFFVSSRYVGDAIATALREVAALRARSNEYYQQEQNLTQERVVIFQDQERIRANLQALKTGAEQQQLAERMVRKLSSQEDRIEQLNIRIAELQEERAVLDHDVSVRIASLASETVLSD
jgi:hypothetical protein